MICPACHYRAPDPLPACPACEAALDPTAPAPPFIGRARALAVLDARLDEALRTGGVHRVGVVGPPGSGRSALMNAFRRRRANAFSTVRTLRVFGDRPLEALGRMVALVAGLDERWSGERRRQVAREHWAAFTPPTAQALETLLFPPAHWAHVPLERLRPALAEFLGLALRQAPLLILVEAVPGAAALLAEALPGDEGAALVLCEAARPDLLALDDQVTCDRLDSNQVSDLLGELAGRGPAPEPLAQVVLAACDGHVGGVREAARALLAAGVAPPHRGDWILPDPLPPLTAARASTQRLDALSPPHRRLLGGAALIGMHFHPALVPALDTDVRFDGAVVAAATRIGLVTEGSGGMLAFVHPIDQAALAAEVPESIARASHALIAHRLLRRQGDEAAPAVAEHLERAGQGAAAAVWRLVVGLRRWAAREVPIARSWVERAVAGLAHEPATARLEALEAAACLAAEDGDEVAARRWWDDLAVAAEEAEDARAEAVAQLGLGGLALERDALDDASAAFEAARRRAKAAHQPGLVAAAVSGLGRVALAGGRLDDAEARLTDALERYAGEGDRAGAAAVLVSMAAVRRRQGQFESALQALDAARGWPADDATRHAEGLERARVLLDAGHLEAAASQLDELRNLPISLRFSARVVALSALVAATRHQDDTARTLAREAAWLATPLDDSRVRERLARVEALLDIPAGPAEGGPE